MEDADALPFSDQEITKILKAGDTINGNRPCGHVKVTPRIDHNYIRINMDYLLVPGAGVEPARLPAAAFKAAVSAVPPPGRWGHGNCRSAAPHRPSGEMVTAERVA